MAQHNGIEAIPFMDPTVVDNILTTFWTNQVTQNTNVDYTGDFTVIFAKQNGALRTMHCRTLGIGPDHDTVIDPLWNGPNNCVVTDRDCDEVRCFSMNRVLMICDTSNYFAQMAYNSHSYKVIRD